MKIVPKWIIESKDPDVEGNGVIHEVIKETEKAVFVIVKYPIGSNRESSKTMWVPKSQINKVKSKLSQMDEMSQIEFTPRGQI